MGFFRQFETFDPISGSVPYTPFELLPGIAWRARELLKSRTAEEIDSAAANIDWAINEYFRELKEKEIAELRRMGAALPLDDNELDVPTAETVSEVDVLRDCIDWWNDIAGGDFVDAKPYETFAVLSLWMLADAIAWLRHQSSEAMKRSLADAAKEVEMSLAGDCALKAMDAVCHAEHLREVARLEAALAKAQSDYLNKEAKLRQEERNRRSMQAEALNVARHRKTNEAKAKVVEEWEKDPSRFRSAEKAGLHLANWLEPQGFTFEPRTVTGWIRTHAKRLGLRLR